MFQFQYLNKQYKFILYLRVQIQNHKYGGFIHNHTIITYDKQLHQQFCLLQSSNLQKIQQSNISAYSQNNDFYHQIKKMIGGHDQHLQLIQRSILNSRNLSPQLIKKFNLKHSKGILLYGPPGTGKTAIARQMASLSTLPVTIINGPQIMDKFVGESQRKLRAPFEAARKDQQQKGANSPVHVIIIDQIDAICKKRGTNSTNVYDSIVNQLLTCIDGVIQLNNILIIAMTNRKDLLDPAILRPGRIQIHAEICLPDELGRLQIFKIHTKHFKINNALHQSVDINEMAKKAKNYTGAEIQAISRKAFNFALSEWKKQQFIETEIGKKHFMHQRHFDQAFKQLIPQFGKDSVLLESRLPQSMIQTNQLFPQISDELNSIIKKINNLHQGKCTILLSGNNGVGKTVLACEIAKKLNFQFIKLVNIDKLIGLDQGSKFDKILDVFYDSLKCKTSCLIFDEIIDLIEYIPLDKHYNRIILKGFIQILKASPQRGRKRVIIVTESRKQLLHQLGLYSNFRFKIQIPMLLSRQIQLYLGNKGYISEQINRVISHFENLSIGQVADIVESTQNNRQQIEKFCKILKGRRNHQQS